MVDYKLEVSLSKQVRDNKVLNTVSFLLWLEQVFVCFKLRLCSCFDTQIMAQNCIEFAANSYFSFHPVTFRTSGVARCFSKGGFRTQNSISFLKNGGGGSKIRGSPPGIRGA